MVEILTAAQVVERVVEQLRQGETVSLHTPHAMTLRFTARVADRFRPREFQERRAGRFRLTNGATLVVSSIVDHLRGRRGVTFLYEATKGGWVRQVSPQVFRLTRFERTFFDDR